MDLRRSILTAALIVLAGLLVWVSFGPLSGTGKVVVISEAAMALAAAGILTIRRRIGSFLAILVGAASFLLGGLLSGLSALGNTPAPFELVATTWVGAGVAVLALVDLIANLLTRRSGSPPA